MTVWMELAGRIRSDRIRRLGWATAVAVGLHLALLALILSWRSPPVLAGAGGVEVSLISLNGPITRGAFKSPEPIATTPAKAKASLSNTSLSAAVVGSTDTLKEQPKFDPPSDLQPILVNVTLGAPPASTGVGQSVAATVTQPPASAAAGGATKTCKIYDVLQATLQTSAEVRAALHLIPAKSRSVANAVLLWDGRWVSAETVGGEPALGPIQAAVVGGINQAPVPCQEELVRGPRVVTVGDAHNTIILAFGSGEWRWADLVMNLPVPQLPSR